MNHPSEWTRYYDVPRGYYRYRHKGTGVVRDTLMAIGRQSLKKAVNEASKKILKKAAEKASEKGAEKIQTVLWGKTPSVKPKGKTVGISNSVATHTPRLSTESKQKLKKMITSGVKPHTPGTSKLSSDSRKKLNQIRAAKLKVNQYLAEN